MLLSPRCLLVCRNNGGGGLGLGSRVMMTRCSSSSRRLAMLSSTSSTWENKYARWYNNNNNNEDNNGMFMGMTAAMMMAFVGTAATTWHNTTTPPQQQQRPGSFVADAVDVASPSLVHVATLHETIFGSLGSGGSGFLIHEDGFVATNAHVVAHSEGAKLTVTIRDGIEVQGIVWAMDRATDLALIKIDAPPGVKLIPAKIGTSSKLRTGEWVAALGSPMNLQNSVTVGVVSSIARHANELGLPSRIYDFIQTDASINTGNSGGPLIDMNGQVVGINTMKAAGPEGISFSIPIDVAWPVLEQLREFKRVRRPFLGLRMVTIDPHVKAMEERRAPKLFPNDITEGVLVVQVAPGSPAEKGGLISGDILVSMNGKPVKETGDVIRALGYDVGKKIKITLRRGKEKVETTVQTESMPMTEA